MNQVVATNRIEIRIGKKRERIARLLTEGAGFFRTVNADGNGTNADGIELIQISLNAPQLGVARRSPIAAVENQQHSLGGFAVDW
jgi:hypothetical protein